MKIIAANWKENPKNEKDALKLFRGVAKAANENVQVVLCPPFIYLDEIAHAWKKMRYGYKPRGNRSAGRDSLHLALGSQDAFWEEVGPFTSEVGPRMLKALGMEYVILGHSERRKWLKETDAAINKKVGRTLEDGLRVILCVGEPLAIRKKGLPAARNYVAAQLGKDLKNVKPRDRKRLMIAYEPIWAIGTGRYDDPEDAREMAEFIKRKINGGRSVVRQGGGGRRGRSGTNGAHRGVPVLYGGSVSSKNIADYVRYNSIDGALVGGASLKVEEFKKIINITCKI